MKPYCAKPSATISAGDRHHPRRQHAPMPRQHVHHVGRDHADDGEVVAEGGGGGGNGAEQPGGAQPLAPHQQQRQRQSGGRGGQAVDLGEHRASPEAGAGRPGRAPRSPRSSATRRAAARSGTRSCRPAPPSPPRTDWRGRRRCRSAPGARTRPRASNTAGSPGDARSRRRSRGTGTSACPPGRRGPAAASLYRGWRPAAATITPHSTSREPTSVCASSSIGDGSITAG